MRTALGRYVITGLLAVGSLVGGCSSVSSGMGGGRIDDPGQLPTSVLFSWQSQDGGMTGKLVATLPDESFQGPFMQITSDTTNDSVAPMWIGWNPGWNDWAFADPTIMGVSDVEGFSHTYSGKVIANLHDARGVGMRCRFDLAQPSTGMAGGGQGECSTSDGRHIDAVIESRD